MKSHKSVECGRRGGERRQAAGEGEKMEIGSDWGEVRVAECKQAHGPTARGSGAYLLASLAFF